MKHVHAEMIKAKVDNMELVVFRKVTVSKWAVVQNEFPEWKGDEYFLCLPQHKDVCLHLLNGGDAEQAQVNDDCWVSCAKVPTNASWMPWTSFMKDELKFRIKPKKEKRLIIYRNNVLYGPFFSDDEINKDLLLTGQLIEIDVEVEN